MTTEPSLRIPVVCPQCGSEVLATLPVARVAAALLQEQRIRLHAQCHGIYWDASYHEIEQLREYMAAPGRAPIAEQNVTT